MDHNADIVYSTEHESMERASRLIDQAAALELNVSKLYSLYAEQYPEHQGFWWELNIEEKNHASLIKSEKNFLSVGRLPEGALFEEIGILEDTNRSILDRIALHGRQQVPMSEAYRFASNLERSAAELHLQRIITNYSESKVVNILQQLGADDVRHAERIGALCQSKGF